MLQNTHMNARRQRSPVEQRTILHCSILFFSLFSIYFTCSFLYDYFLFVYLCCVVFLPSRGVQMDWTLSSSPLSVLLWSACNMPILITSLSQRALNIPSAQCQAWPAPSVRREVVVHVKVLHNVLIKKTCDGEGRLWGWEVDHRVRDICPHKHEDRWTPSWGPSMLMNIKMILF